MGLDVSSFDPGALGPSGEYGESWQGYHRLGHNGIGTRVQECLGDTMRLDQRQIARTEATAVVGLGFRRIRGVASGQA